MPLPMLTSSKASRISLKLTGMAQLLLHDHFRPDRDPLSCTYAQLEEPVRYDLAQVLSAGRRR